MNKEKEINIKILKAEISLRNSDYNTVGVYTGKIKKLSEGEKDFLKDNNLIYIHPYIYKLSYVNTWINRSE